MDTKRAAAALGKKGGKSRSPRKVKAARESMLRINAERAARRELAQAPAAVGGKGGGA